MSGEPSHWSAAIEDAIFRAVAPRAERRTGQIGDPSIREFADNRVTPDVEVHRLRILGWWLAYYGSLDARERGAFTPAASPPPAQFVMARAAWPGEGRGRAVRIFL